MNKDGKQEKIAKIKRHKEDYLAQTRKEKELDDLLTRMNIATDPCEKSVLFAWYVEKSREA